MAQPHERVRRGRWRRFTAAMPMRTALLGVTAVWALGCVWSFQEQWHFAAAKGFTMPWLLPLVIDGMAAAMAGVAYAASLDGRAAIPARVATALAVAASAASNAAWAWERSAADVGAVTLAVGIPIAANLAFEVLLSELRRQMQRRRGQPPPVAVPYPRVIRFVLAPRSTFTAWRRLVLELTDPREACAPALAVVPELVREPEPAAEPAPEPATAPIFTVPASSPRASEVSSPAEPDPQPAGAESTGTEPVAGDLVGDLVGAQPAASEPAAHEPAAHEPLTSVPPVREPLAAANGRASTTNGVRPVPAPRALLSAGTPDARVRRVADLISRGEELTGESVGELLGCSARTGRRLLRQGTELAEATGSQRRSEAIGR